MVIHRKKINWIFYLVAVAMLLSAVYTATLSLPTNANSTVTFDLGQSSMGGVRHSVPESSSQNINRPIGVLVIDLIVRAGKNHLHDTVIRSILFYFFNILFAGCLAVGLVRILVLLCGCIHSRSIIVHFIHRQDGAK